jgi:hypothetical protein
VRHDQQCSRSGFDVIDIDALLRQIAAEEGLMTADERRDAVLRQRQNGLAPALR